MHQKQLAQENFRALMKAEEMDFVIIDEAFDDNECMLHSN